MAYGKIKVDTLTWDDSGTDTDVTIGTIPVLSNANTVTGVTTIQNDVNFRIFKLICKNKKESINSLKKVLAKRYNKNPPTVFPNISIAVPNHFPKIKPIIKVGISIGVNNKFNTIVITKKIIVRMKMLLSLYFRIVSLFSFINSKLVKSFKSKFDHKK